MRRALCTVAAAVAAAALVAPAFVSPASAARLPVGGPGAYCKSVYQPMENPVTGATYDQYVIPVRFDFGGGPVVEPFGIASFSGCVSTVAQGMGSDGVVSGAAISRPAYLAQCDLLEDFGVVSYPYTFYGTYPAENRSDCARILKGVHTGELELPGPPPGS